MDLVEEAVALAAGAHRGQKRKGEDLPYILHPLEVMLITASMTAEPEVLAAAVLHDTVEDTPVTAEEIRERFGERTAALVASETEDKRADLPPEDTWEIRKKESLDRLAKERDPGVKILWLSDKLSNMRAIARHRRAEGDAVWKRFHQTDPARQKWYYESIARILDDLKDHPAWQEYDRLVKEAFGGETE